MEIIQKQLFFILCGAVALAGVGLGAWGISQMSAIDAKMDDAVNLHRQLQNATPRNRAAIAAQHSRVEAVRRNYEEVLKLTDEHAGHKELIEGFFPNPVYAAQFEFPRVYRASLDGLYQRLRAGSPPTAAEVRDAEERIRDEERARGGAAFGVDPNEARLQGGGTPDEDEPTSATGVITTAQARRDPYVRASIAKARGIYCYAAPPDHEKSALSIIPSVYSPGAYAPIPEACWDAQVQFWIQQDVVEALARANEKAAEQLPPENQWVGHLPIKHVFAINVNPRYVGTETGPTPEAFTGNTSGPEYEVLYFSLDLIVDARHLNSIIAEICNNSYTTLYQLDYQVEPPNLRMEEYIYGPEPVIRVKMSFERILYSKPYLKLMPDIVLQDLGKERPIPESETAQ
jgi:hypothetical protein